MAFLLTYLRPVVPPGQALTKIWIRCLSDFSDYVRPPGPMCSWSREEYNTHRRWKYATDADFRRKQLGYSKNYSKTRYANDPDWRQAKVQREHDKYTNDPYWRQAKLRRDNDRYANNPDYRQASLQRKNQRAKERYANDPVYRQSVLQRYAERRAADPALREADLLRKRERYANDPEYKARKNQRDAERRLRKKLELATENDKSDPQIVSTSRNKPDGPALEP